MASLYQYRSDIMLIYQRLMLSKDKRLTERHAEFLIHKYRAIAIRDNYKANREIDPATLQDLGRVEFTQVNSADDPVIPYGSVKLGKLTIPQVVSLPDDRGIYRVASSSKLCEHYRTTQSLFFDIPPGSIQAKFDWYFRVNTALYISPVRTEGNVVLILDNPMDGFILLTEFVLSGNIEAGISYTVQTGQVIYNSIAYNAGQSFTGVLGIVGFTGTGTVKNTIQKRPITIYDNYPMSFTMAEQVLLKMFYQEFKIEQQQVLDTKNDAQDQLGVYKTGSV